MITKSDFDESIRKFCSLYGFTVEGKIDYSGCCVVLRSTKKGGLIVYHKSEDAPGNMLSISFASLHLATMQNVQTVVRFNGMYFICTERVRIKGADTLLSTKFSDRIRLLDDYIEQLKSVSEVEPFHPFTEKLKETFGAVFVGRRASS